MRHMYVALSFGKAKIYLDVGPRNLRYVLRRKNTADNCRYDICDLRREEGSIKESDFKFEFNRKIYIHTIKLRNCFKNASQEEVQIMNLISDYSSV